MRSTTGSARRVARLRAYANRVARDSTPGRRQRIALAVDEVERFAEGRRLRVLDAGSEDGLFSMRLAKRHPDWTYVAIDRVFEPLARGRAEATSAGRAVSYVQADLTRTAAVESVDVVVALECLMEIPDDDAALAVLARALRPGGLLVLQVPAHDWTPVLRRSERSWRREVRHGYHGDELGRWIASAGFTVRSVRPTFHRAAALAQDWRDAVKGRSAWVRAALAPVHLLAVTSERAGIRIGRPRAWFVVATKN